MSLPVRAEAPPALLLHPERALVDLLGPGPEVATLSLSVDGHEALSFANPEILIDRTNGPVEFIAAVWKDAAGHPLYQREVLVVKPDYAVVVDYLFDHGRHSIMRRFTFPSPITPERQGAQVRLVTGQVFRVQAIDAAVSAVGKGDSGDRELTLSSIAATPAPFATVVAIGKGDAVPEITPVKAYHPLVVKVRLRFPGGRIDDVALAWESRPLHVADKKLSGWAALVRSGSDDSGVIEIQ